MSGEGSLRGGPPCIPVPWDPRPTALVGRASGPSTHRLLDLWASGSVGGRGVAKMAFGHTWRRSRGGSGRRGSHKLAPGQRWGVWGVVSRRMSATPRREGALPRFLGDPSAAPSAAAGARALRRVSSPRREPGRCCSVRWRDHCVLWCSGGCSWAAL